MITLSIRLERIFVGNKRWIWIGDAEKLGNCVPLQSYEPKQAYAYRDDSTAGQR